MELLHPKALTSLPDSSLIKRYVALGQAIEFAHMPQQHEVFLAFFNIGDHFAELLSDQQKWHLYRVQFELLLSAVVNTALPSSWRRASYETLNKPLLSLQRIAKDNERRKQLNSLYLQLNKEISLIFKQSPF